MTAEKTLFQIDIRYDDSASGAEMQALADELVRRGHTVSVKKYAPRGSFVGDLTRSAREIKELADNVRGVAENGIQILRDMAESFVKPSESSSKGVDEKASEASIQGQACGFDEIGPEAAAASRASSNHAVIVTCPEALADQSLEAMRIGLLPKTVLDRAWQPAGLDAIVIPHGAFRPYLEKIHWNPEHIFEGGYLALKSDCPTKTREEAQVHFQLKRESGPILLVMASGIPSTALQTLMIQLTLLKMPMQVFFYHGGDSYKADMLRALAQRFAINARMFGRVNGLPDYLAIADMAIIDVMDENFGLVQNAGVPMVVLAGKEVPAKVNFLSHERAALVAPEMYKLSTTLAQPLSEPAVLQALQGAAAHVMQYASVEKCADAIEAALAKKGEIILDPRERVASVDGFEVIGTQVNPQSFLTPQYQMVQPVSEMGVNSQVAPEMMPAMVQPVMPMAQMAPHAHGVVQPPPQMLTPGLGARSKEELKSEYAKLLLVEKNLDKSLDAASADVRKWEERLDLARQAQRDDLVNSALASLQVAQSQEIALFQQKDQIQEQKAMLKQSARLAGSQLMPDASKFASGQIENELFGPSNEELALEKEFTRLQKEGALQRLKDKLGK